MAGVSGASVVDEEFDNPTIQMIGRCMRRSSGPPNTFMDLTDAQRAEVSGKSEALSVPSPEFSAPSDRGVEGHGLFPMPDEPPAPGGDEGIF